MYSTAEDIGLLISHVRLKRAPEPSDLLWENLEVPNFSKSIRQLFTGLLSLCLVFVGAGAIVTVAVAQVIGTNDNVADGKLKS